MIVNLFSKKVFAIVILLETGYHELLSCKVLIQEGLT